MGLERIRSRVFLGGFAMQCDKNDYRGVLAGLEGVTGNKAVDSEAMTVNRDLTRRACARPRLLDTAADAAAQGWGYRGYQRQRRGPSPDEYRCN